MYTGSHTFIEATILSLPQAFTPELPSANCARDDRLRLPRGDTIGMPSSRVLPIFGV
jgi:hypothetical protein